ncbi:alpha-L-glutamate ligase-like protein [Moritella yayanosii]|uniref:Alpha-L-glutamate ligase-like protein n=1 Tax=Moritella yayanosii TaxID=69539 RepID=A0A330LKI6_9GAMM|nr:alpha-L-glutamate ligase-like protein [Moritella yayanosii]SQD76511.1 Alpha-L-glutamate ligase-like protein [Moritella yayanosii]
MTFSFFKEFAMPSKLKQQGILGMNQRNNMYISRYNPRKLFPLVDNKLKTKEIAEEANLSTPELIGVVDNQHAVKSVNKLIESLSGFVIKPAKGSGGKGILVITKVEDGRYYKPSGSECSLDDIERHCTNILAGLFSLGGGIDVAIVEALIIFDDSFEGYSFEGVPDIRVIVFKGIPMMAMMRLSTSMSDGKANLHQGAVGVGIDITTGVALNAVQHDEIVTHHPDTQKELAMLKVPHWEEVIRLAAQCYDISGLGYLGADVVLDQHHGPMLLELNARPGLAIQIANGMGLLPRLQQIEAANTDSMDLDQRLAYCKQHFG